jgi:hypothetical protein
VMDHEKSLLASCCKASFERDSDEVRKWGRG